MFTIAHFRLTTVYFFVLSLLAVCPAKAQLNQWMGPGQGYNDGANWSLGHAPTSTENAQVDTGPTAILDLAPSSAPRSMSIGTGVGSTGGVAVTDGNVIHTAVGPFIVGNAGHGTLALIDAAGADTTANNFIVAAQANSVGVVTATGGAHLAIDGQLRVGDSGNGSLTASANSFIICTRLELGTFSGGTGTMTLESASNGTVNGTAVIGDIGHGTLNINGGSGLTVNGQMFIANSTLGGGGDGVGVVNVNGVNDTTVSSFLAVNNNNLDVGAIGNGTLNIQAGAFVNAQNIRAGRDEGSFGVILVDGVGANTGNHSELLATNDLSVGGTQSAPGGNGILTITNHGIVHVENNMWVWGTTPAQGTLAIDSTYTLIVPNTLTFDGGELRFLGSGADFVNNAFLGNTTDFGGMFANVAASQIDTISGQLSGPGTLVKDGPGTLVITNANIHGATEIDAGTLIVANPNALGAGNTTILAGTLRTSEAMPLTYNVADSFHANAGTLLVQVGGTDAGEHDLMQVTNAVTLNGSGLFVHRILGFTPLNGDTVTIITAGTGVTGMFDGVSSDFGLVQPRVIYNSNDVMLEFIQGSFNIGGLTPNQRAVAHALNSAVNDPRADVLLAFLDSEPLGNLPHDYDLIAPEELASIYEIGFSQAVVQNMNLQHRMDDIRAGSNGFCGNGFVATTSGKDDSGKNVAMEGGKVVLPASTNVMTPSPENRWGVFATGSGDFVNVGDDFNAHGYDITSGNVTVGADYRLGNHFAIGIDGTYAGSTADLVDGGRVEVDGGKAGAYATVYGFKIFGSVVHVDAAASGGWNSYDTRRTSLDDIAPVTGYDDTARGSTNGSEFNAMLSYGADWHFGCLDIGTWSTLQYTDVNIDSFTETGSLVPLHFPDQDEDSLRGTTGIRLAYDMKSGRTIFRPEVRAAWQHESGDRAYPIDARFASGAGDLFTVHGPAIGRDSALVDAGFSVLWSNRISAYVFYDGVLGRSNYDNNAVSGGLRVSF